MLAWRSCGEPAIGSIAMLIAHVSDSHISLGGPTDAERLAALEACVVAINRLDPQPDLIVHSGDVVHNGTAAEYRAAGDVLAQLRVPLAAIPGNKDERTELLDAFPLPGGTAQCAGFAQFVMDHDGARLIFLDTKSENSNRGTMCEARFAHFADAMTGNDRPVIVFAHHPPFDVPTLPEPFQFEDRAIADRFLDLCHGCTQPVTLITGHVHRPYEGRVGNVDVRTLTALAIDLRKGDAMGDWAEDPFYYLDRIGAQGALEATLTPVRSQD